VEVEVTAHASVSPTARVSALRPWGTFVVLPLALGVLAYLTFRAPGIRLFSWAHGLGLDGAVSTLRDVGAPVRAHLPSWLLGSAPDAAWAFSFGAAVGLVWRGRTSRAAWAWRVGCGIVAATVELGQGLGVVPGVFDYVDLGSMVGGYALGCWLVTRAGAARARSRTCPADTSSTPRPACPPPAPR
jgi:hypothetical protein